MRLRNVGCFLPLAIAVIGLVFLRWAWWAALIVWAVLTAGLAFAANRMDKGDLQRFAQSQTKSQIDKKP
jgi:membrane protein implicated in regulation of membrane protease activity